MTSPIHVLMTGDDLLEPASRILDPIGARIETMSGPIDRARMIATLAARRFDAILVRANPPLDAAVLDAAPGLALISKMGAGVDSVDLAGATERNIPVMTAGDANADATAEMAIALILAIRRDVVRLDARLKAGIWDRGPYRATELRGQTLGIVGLGRIGRRVGEMARALGMRVIASGRPGAAASAQAGFAVMPLDQLLAESDIVSLHCPMDANNRGFFDRNTISRMKPGALLVNTARGGLLNEADIAEALVDGRLGGAALDTLAVEPPAAGNPLLTAPNTIITPHIAAETAATMERIALMGAENIVNWFSRREILVDRLVNRAVLSRLKDVSVI
ncbi:NAD-binding D-isomer specific 2-hydroxyacid dehydrogenase [Kaistia sp. 32K]|uniref:NAD(P)-dependent oxidoreductase n=1 Tax=Kaistia sp. 32K TaxID=2795690 RepID=UPI0019168B13|nr:NAD(P)-dependent oxidoreductase [Kaistia sp. 32K]BCP52902.1 NAD-binding D-isomer specific 2-hydroxyacid dehydrogenase [Kaistia sp. 32K]